MNNISVITKIGDKFGTIGAVVATMGCAMCFPALAGIGAALGMGFFRSPAVASQPHRNDRPDHRSAQHLSMVPVQLAELDPIRRSDADGCCRDLGSGCTRSSQLQ